jgi:hypothetical protein
MVSNDEIKRRLSEKRSGKIKKDLAEDPTPSSEEIKEKFRSKLKSPKVEDGYLVCEKCWGYYKLQPGESPEDFDYCECGGKLRYTENLNDIK